MSWMMVFVTGKGAQVRKIPKNELGFICLIGLATVRELALLLQSLAGWAGQRRRADRQTEHPRDHFSHYLVFHS